MLAPAWMVICDECSVGHVMPGMALPNDPKALAISCPPGWEQKVPLVQGAGQPELKHTCPKCLARKPRVLPPIAPARIAPRKE